MSVISKCERKETYRFKKVPLTGLLDVNTAIDWVQFIKTNAWFAFKHMNQLLPQNSQNHNRIMFGNLHKNFLSKTLNVP